MKVIFLQDVPNVARAGEVKEVASGYGREMIYPTFPWQLVGEAMVYLQQLVPPSTAGKTRRTRGSRSQWFSTGVRCSQAET